ncbi:MAG TPA: glycosyltransferase [Pyrinomonadaceae bacterium]|nr:glycosyltransferase [Pyrinomonadaceae bacterium]
MNRRLIANTYLQGQGIEIGALHNPLEVPKAAKVRYVDRMHAAELRRHYPELEALPLVPVDIISDGERLEVFEDETQDFVIANHFLEHCQNPINALMNMLRVLRPGGVLYLAVPDKRFTFDADRPVTTLEHLLRDYAEGPEWSKEQHFREWARLVSKAEGEAAMKAEAARLMELDYSIHFHVWTQAEIMEVLLALKERFNARFEIELLLQNGHHEVIAVLRKEEKATPAPGDGADSLTRQADSRLEAKEQELLARDQELRARENALQAVSTELTAKATQLNNILNSRAWRWVNHYGRAKDRLLFPLRRRLRSASNSSSQTSPQYEKWIREHGTLTDADREAIKARIEELEYRPLLSVLMPTYEIAECWLRAAIESVRRQIYTDWELCIADDCSTSPHVRRVLEEYSGQDERIKVSFRRENGHIAAASNSALALATGEFVAFLDHDDELSEHALYMVVEELNAHRDAALIYSDEDKLSAEGARHGPHFKPAWNPDLFYSYNLITHLGVYRKSLVESIGGLREGFPGSQDYDLALRVIEQVSPEQIRHIPHILYHWRAIPGSVALDGQEKEYAHEAARDAIRAHFERRGVNAEVTAAAVHTHRVIYSLPEHTPLVSVIMSTRDRLDLLRQAVRGVLEETFYPAIELLIIDNRSASPDTLVFLEEIQGDSRVRVIRHDAPFNFARINNLGVRQSKGDLLCLLNNDVKVISKGWLGEMVSHAIRPEIGAVGAKLYYADDRIQHAGVVLGIGGIAGHAHRHFPRESVGYAARAQVIQNYSAVTGACMVLRREVFEEVEGLDEINLPVSYNDIDLCLRIRERGYRILWTPYAELYHLESATRGSDEAPEHRDRAARERDYMRLKWGHLLVSDPYYNPNLTLETEDFAMARVPRAVKPWKQPGQEGARE